MLQIINRYIKTSALALLQNPFSLVSKFKEYFSDYGKLKSEIDKKKEFKISPVYPFLHDKVIHPRTFSRYIYQDSWAFHHIKESNPEALIDIGSSRYFVAFAAQTCNVLYVDIRLVESHMDTIFNLCGDINSLPFADESLEAISSLSVIEHIGLGRYGDKIDAEGIQKAIFELKRVLKRKGLLLVALPVGSDNVILYNAHRICTPEKILELFDGLTLVEEKYALMDRLVSRDKYEALGRPYAYGCYRFTK